MRRVILVLLLLVSLTGCKAQDQKQKGSCYKPTAYELNTVKKLYVNACAISPPFYVEKLPILVAYAITSHASKAIMENYAGLFRMHNMQVAATTTYTHPITYPEGLPFTLIINFTYVGKSRNDIGDRLDCWTEVDIGKPTHEISELRSVLITRNNFDKFPMVQCEFVN